MSPADVMPSSDFYKQGNAFMPLTEAKAGTSALR
jgi:hypothetical protein